METHGCIHWTESEVRVTGKAGNSMESQPGKFFGKVRKSFFPVFFHSLKLPWSHLIPHLSSRQNKSCHLSFQSLHLAGSRLPAKSCAGRGESTHELCFYGNSSLGRRLIWSKVQFAINFQSSVRRRNFKPTSSKIYFSCVQLVESKNFFHQIIMKLIYNILIVLIFPVNLVFEIQRFTGFRKLDMILTMAIMKNSEFIYS